MSSDFVVPEIKFVDSLSTACWGVFDGATTFGAVYRVTSSPNYGLKVTLAQPSQDTNITIATISSKAPVSVSVPAGSSSITTHISLAASSNNTITIHNAPAISSIQVTPPNSTYYTGTEDFTLSDSADTFTCLDDFCIPTGSKITTLSTNSSATTQIPSMAQGFKYIEINYINNKVAFDSAWEWGSNSRNLTIRVNDAEPVRLEVPLSGRHSELLRPGLGWWDSARLGVLTGGWKVGLNEVMLGNENGECGFTSFAPDVVGISVHN